LYNYQLRHRTVWYHGSVLHLVMQVAYNYTGQIFLLEDTV